jgi:amylosucrase
MIALRKRQPAFGAAAETQVFALENRHIFAFRKRSGEHAILVIGNFTEEEQGIASESLGAGFEQPLHRDLISGVAVDLSQVISVPPYGLLWLVMEAK